MLVRITLLLNLVALAVVVAVILQLELPAGDDLANLADAALARLDAFAQAVRPWAEAALDRLSAWAEAAWRWAAEHVDRVRDWVERQRA
jgi:hypothetical protein